MTVRGSTGPSEIHDWGFSGRMNPSCRIQADERKLNGIEPGGLQTFLPRAGRLAPFRFPSKQHVFTARWRRSGSMKHRRRTMPN